MLLLLFLLLLCGSALCSTVIEEVVVDTLARATRTLLVGKNGLEHAKQLLTSYKQGQIKEMTAELWTAKKVVDSTLHPGTSFSWKCECRWIQCVC